jgi:urate oxidase
LQEIFANHHSLALQHTLYEMGSAVLAAQPQVAEIRSRPQPPSLRLRPGRFGLENDNEVFHADDRPHG